MARPVHQALNILGGAFEDRLDPAIGKVAYPPANPALQGHPPAGVAEEDALNLAGDQYPVADHKPTLRPDRRRCGTWGYRREPAGLAAG